MAICAADWTRAREIFESALALPESERSAYVAAASGDHIAVRDEVVRMLASHGRLAGFLSTPAAVAIGTDSIPAFDGERIGPYLLQGRIGFGGMGQVYKARDTRLDRTVALKLLPSQRGHDPEMPDRFDREARAIAALSHPHICALYDVGEATMPITTDEGSAPRSIPVRYLVMEHLEGETLAARLGRGALPIAQALHYGVQIVSALEQAHRGGIVHRDLKPANVMLVKSGAKLLDFGLARFATAQSRGSASHALVTPSRSTELTTPGMIVGTVQYMAPEQLEGREADTRTDIFAVGTMLYEMLTGTKAFRGSNQLSVGAAILEQEPTSLRTLLPSVPPALERLVQRCLAKDPDERWQSTSDLASELRWIAQTAPQDAARPPSSTSWTRRTALVSLAAVSGITLLAAFVLRSSPALPPAGAPKHFVVTIPDINRVYNLALLPDGSGIAYISERDRRVHVQTLGDGGSRSYPGTEGRGQILVSPDGRWLAFQHDTILEKVEVTGGGLPLTVAEALCCHGTWAVGDRMVFGGVFHGLTALSVSEGKRETLTTLQPGELGHIRPTVLPSAKALLFTVMRQSGVMPDATIEALSFSSKERRVLVKGATNPLYSPTGHLLYVQGADLLAARFDIERLAITSDPVRVLSGIYVGEYLSAQIALSADGTLAYLPGAGEQLERTLLWVHRDGAVVPVPMGERPYAHINALPDEKGLIVEIEGATHNIWHQDLESGVLTPLTSGAGNHRPVLSPDGRLMVYSSDRTKPRSLFMQPTDGSGAAEHLVDASGAQNASGWSPDGQWVAFDQFQPETKSDVWVVSMQGEHRARPFLQTPFSERQAVFSPQGRSVAYTSDESGQSEVMVTTFPVPGRRKQVSIGGGSLPVFSRDGRHLLYRLGDAVWDAEILSADDLSFAAPRKVFDIPHANSNFQLPFPVSSTADAVLYPRDLEGGFTRVHVIVNFFEELRRLTSQKSIR